MESKFEARVYNQIAESREKRLYEASVSGSVDSLAQLMSEDPLTIARSAVTCFDETPLHIAAMLGHLDFAKALLQHKPDMAMAMDWQRRSPLHLAAANGYVEIVSLLVSLHPNACLIPDDDGRTPLHLAVMKGQVEATRELVLAGPQMIRHKLNQGETLLHSAVKHNRLETLKLLVELVDEVEFANARDDHGNTVLHAAAALKQFETVKFLLDGTRVEVNAVNANGSTALDIIENIPRDLKCMEIRESLAKSGALRARDVTPPPPHSITERELALVTEDPQPAISQPKSGGSGSGLKNIEDWLKNKHEALMITASVIAAMAYQAGLNPPGGVWQEDKSGHVSGTSIMRDKNGSGFSDFKLYNTVAFISSLSTIVLLISGIPMKRRFFMWILMVTVWFTILFILLTYLVSIKAISKQDVSPQAPSPFPSETPTYSPTSNTPPWIFLILILIALLAHPVIRFFTSVVPKFIQKRRASHP